MNNQKGFTLIELIVTVAMLGIVLSVAIPFFREMMYNTRMTTTANMLHTSTTVARHEAIKRGIGVSICSSFNQESCSGLSNWSNGWIVFTDQNKNGERDGSDEILQVGPKSHPSQTIIGGQHTLTFFRDGSLKARG